MTRQENKVLKLLMKIEFENMAGKKGMATSTDFIQFCFILFSS